jgi:hypothetical protein
MTPFEADLGRTPRDTLGLLSDPKDQADLPHLPSHLNHILQGLRDKLAYAQHEYAYHANKSRRPVEFNAGDLVLLDTRNIYRSTPFKLGRRFEGPFRIIKKYSPVVYELELPMDWNISPTFNVDLLRPFNEPLDDDDDGKSNDSESTADGSEHSIPDPSEQNHTREPTPPVSRGTSKQTRKTRNPRPATPSHITESDNSNNGDDDNDNEDGGDHYDVEKVLAARIDEVTGLWEYRIKWLDCDEITWEPESNLSPSVLRKARRLRPASATAPRRSSRR